MKLVTQEEAIALGCGLLSASERLEGWKEYLAFPCVNVAMRSCYGLPLAAHERAHEDTVPPSRLAHSGEPFVRQCREFFVLEDIECWMAWRAARLLGVKED
jgi:hypothetical protein